MSGRRITARWQKWQKIVSEQESSGQTVAEFCRRRDLSPATFYSWRRKMPSAPESSSVLPAPMFVPLPLTESVAPGVFEVKLPNGICVTVPPKFESSTLASLLQTATEVDGNA